ncbi:MAG: YiiX/YebB-like N1pC/P60 family cysteine hydrolase [Planctomycetota bacterium]
MKLIGGQLLNRRWKKAVALVVCLMIIGGAYAGWSIQRATDPTRVDPIIVPEHVDLKSGDIIVAGGVSLQSRMVMSLTEGNHYSHVGLIQSTPDGLFVIHAAPTGAGDGGLGDRVARIPLSLFLSERGYVAVQVMRVKVERADSSQLAQDACDYAFAIAEQAIPFDGNFDLAEQEKIYCSELIYLAYRHAGLDWPDTLIRSVSTMLKDGPVILPEAFTQCDVLETIWQHSNEREKS